MLKLGRVTKVKVLFLMLVFVFYFDLFQFSAAILEKGLLFSLDQLGYPAITNIFAVNQIIRYNGVLAITKTPL